MKNNLAEDGNEKKQTSFKKAVDGIYRPNSFPSFYGNFSKLQLCFVKISAKNCNAMQQACGSVLFQKCYVQVCQLFDMCGG